MSSTGTTGAPTSTDLAAGATGTSAAPTTSGPVTPSTTGPASSPGPVSGPARTTPASSPPATSPATSAAPSPTTTKPPTGTVVSSTKNAKYGDILVDGQGRTLYEFTPDNGASSPQCGGGCAQTWPPLKASGTPHAEGSAKQSLLGTEAGQVTYNGHPLYRYSGDSAAGQTNGQGIGGIWYVMGVNGSPVLT